MHTHTEPLVGRVGEKIAAHIDVIAGYFKPGALVTVVVRAGQDEATRDSHTADMILTSDKIPKVIAALQHHLTAKDTQHAQVQAED